MNHKKELLRGPMGRDCCGGDFFHIIIVPPLDRNPTFYDVGT